MSAKLIRSIPSALSYGYGLGYAMNTQSRTQNPEQPRTSQNPGNDGDGWLVKAAPAHVWIEE